VQQLSVNDYYELGKQADRIEARLSKIDGEADVSAFAWPLFSFRWKLFGLLQAPCALLPASQRAATGIIKAISDIIPEDFDKIFEAEAKATKIPQYKFGWVLSAIKKFETVLANDMPEMSTFSVAQLGIYRTEDLIHRAQLQIDESVRSMLLPLALADLKEAGKCLAFRVPTAAAFHLSRAIETGMNQYFEALTGKPYELKPAANNWAIKTQLLKDNGADEKITEFLIHIRRSYRNPITHPDVILEPPEAFNFFSQAISVISMMLDAVKAKNESRQPLLTGLTEEMSKPNETDPEATGDVRSGNEENPLSLEAGTPAEA
jgi:hypothetical protein